ncbi:uncharacterized protein Z518_04682 [Rhinocladiella mackenziei CBS 650.93]|uniref:Cytochrome P450 n=1 Tax=Rhinocladiella mackenziei CBS 650.93 TaxID=1442369 RepID=A0A0D2IU65_9EURO|nr:uncharacterized protein Z518_04682 [Rhinocladiella mackenziei CBS 650.93]KIX06706.1 hypothetical protein Z518_04682 [Rhinocladiella mackenziei CBS 650.93]
MATLYESRPTELSCIYPEAWADIYGHKNSAEREFSKDPTDFPIDARRREYNIISSNHENHRRQRKLLSHAFSEQAMRGQEPLLMQYVDLFIQRLHERKDEPVDIIRWLNFTTFDIMGELGFGEPFGCLKTRGYHEWVDIIFQNVRIGSQVNAVKFYPLGEFLLELLLPESLKRKRDAHKQLAWAKADQRMQLGVTAHGDLMSQILKHNDTISGMSHEEIRETTSLLIIAGSETTATALSGLVYLLGMHPHPYKRVVEEIRTAFSSEEEITLLTASKSTHICKLV